MTFKYAEVAPIHKKGDTLDKRNYRPVSVLPIMSKIFECLDRTVDSILWKYIFAIIYSPVIYSQSEVKLLGVHIDSKLTFTNHIKEICLKAGRQINMIARLSKTLNIDAKQLLFKTFILSHFNYCPLVWHFCGIEDMNKNEKVQKRALQFVYNDFNSSYSSLRERSDRPLLYTERIRKIAMEVLKMYHHMGPTYLYNFISPKEYGREMRSLKPVIIPRFKSIKYGKNSLKYQGAYIWNSLSNDLKTNMDLKMFKRLIMDWNGPVCNCSYCKLCTATNI